MLDKIRQNVVWVVIALVGLALAVNQHYQALEQRHSFCAIRETRQEAYIAYKQQLANTTPEAPVSPFVAISQHERLRLIRALDYLDC